MIIPIDQLYTFLASFGSSKTGKTVKFQVLDNDGLSVLAPDDSSNWASTIIAGDNNTYVESGKVVELGEGEYGITIKFKATFSGFVRFWDETDDLVISDAVITTSDWVSQITRILGLSHENVKITDPVYDASNNLESATLTTYTDATLTTAVASYTITSVGTGVNKFSSWQQVKN